MTNNCGTAQAQLDDPETHYYVIPCTSPPRFSDTLINTELGNVEISHLMDFQIFGSSFDRLVAEGNLYLKEVNATEIIAAHGGTVYIEGNLGVQSDSKRNENSPVIVASLESQVIEQGDEKTIEMDMLARGGSQMDFEGTGDLIINGQITGRYDSTVHFRHEGERNVTIGSMDIDGNLEFGSSNQKRY